MCLSFGEQVYNSVPDLLRSFVCGKNRRNVNRHVTVVPDKMQFCSGMGIWKHFVCYYCMSYESFIFKIWTFNRTSNAESMKNT